MKKILLGLMAVILLTACNKGDVYPYGTPREGITRVCDYLYEITIDYDYDPSVALALLTDPNNAIPKGACSSVRNGNFFGRNFDWYYDPAVEFIVHVPHTDKHFASVGIVGGVGTITASIIENQQEDILYGGKLYDALPYVTIDGINENGVVCNINMLPVDDCGSTDNINPGGVELTMTMVPRYVLDNAQSAAHAVEMLKDVNIRYSPAAGMDFHFMIADEKETYIVEWIDGEMRYRNDVKVLTNYTMCINPTPHSMGLERYDLLTAHYDEGNSMAGMAALMQRAQYTKMYDRSTNPFWYSEYNGDWTALGFGDLTINSQPSDYEKVIANDLANYNKHIRDIRYDIWQTIHTSVYDIQNRSMNLYVQENYDKMYSYKVQ